MSVQVEERVAQAIHKAHREADYPWWHSDPNKCRLSKEIARAAIDELLTALADGGFVVIEREPTKAMRIAGNFEICGEGSPSQRAVRA